MAKTPEDVIRDEVRALKAYPVPDGIELLLGNGSDELIQTLALAARKPGAAVLGVEPSFVMFRMIATFAGTPYVGVELRDDYSLDIEKLLGAVERHRPGLIFIAYPNNPTGNLFDAGLIERVIEAAPGLVVIDEAYHGFSGESFLPRLAGYPNLLVMRTLSKLGLAGLRLGVLMGAERWIRQLDKLRLPYNVNTLTQLIAAVVLEYGSVLTDQAAAIKLERGRLLRELQRVPGVTAYPSDANFILFRISEAERIFDGLKRRGVLIKSLHGSHRLLADCLRVTVGTPDENAAFLTALTQTLNA